MRLLLAFDTHAYTDEREDLDLSTGSGLLSGAPGVFRGVKGLIQGPNEHVTIPSRASNHRQRGSAYWATHQPPRIPDLEG